MSRSLFTTVLLLVAVGSPRPAGSEDTRPSRPPRASAWTASTVRGSPDPSPPYRTERSFPHLSFKSPVLIAPVPGTRRLVVAEQEGVIYTFVDDRSTGDADLFFDLRRVHPRLVAVYGLAFAPDYEESRAVYICYVLRDGEDGTVVSRFRVQPGDPPACDPASEEALIRWLGGGHNGGCLQFGPDRHLYISTGDGTGPFPPDGLDTGQDNSDLLSAILRIDPTPAADASYSIPHDNPFVEVAGTRPEIWAYGFRNPWKMSFDPRSGDLWVGDVGWELWEMIYRVERGGNYGWSVTEGRQPVHPERARGLTPILPPVVDHSHAEARSVTGGRVYRGSRLRDLAGAYVYADYETGKMWGLRHDGRKVTWHAEIATAALKIVAFGESHSGELHFLDHAGGTIHSLIENKVSEENASFPLRLSDTGLFASTPEETPAPGVLAYEINAEPWTDHATARRFIGLPGESRITRPALPRDLRQAYRDRWEFPPDTVLVRTFELEMEQGNPASRRKIETQILHRADTSWRGYSYAWNDEQTDATLVEALGREHTYRVLDRDAPGGERRQTWRFSGRGECIVCHNHFGGYVLGFNLRQLNRLVSGPDGHGSSQLRMLEEQGIFTEPYAPTEGLPAFPAPYDPLPGETPRAGGTLEERARSYLHVNCSPCHQRHAGGTSWMELLYEIPLEETHAIGRAPSQGTFGIDAAALVAPGAPERSLVYYRMATLGPPRMPHIGSSIVDERGLSLIREWIARMPGAPSTDAASSGDSDIGELVERRMASTSGALGLVTSLDRGEVPNALRQAVIERAAARAGLNTRGLLARFLPASERREELGSVIRPETVLARRGDAARGGKLFLENDALQCRNCHTVDGTLRSVGPDLSLVGRRLSRGEVLQSIVSPAATVPPRYAPYLLITKDGQAHTGVLAGKTAHAVTLRNTQNREVVVATQEVEALTPQPGSLMPEQLLRGLTIQEASDLLEYLCSLR